MTTVVKNYMSHEKKFLTEITKIRSDYNETVPTSKIMAAEKQMSQWLGYVSMALKNNQDFKAIKAIVLLQRTIIELTEQISATERAYNVSVVDYNRSIAVFLINIIKGIFGLKAYDYLEVAREKKKILDIRSLF
ncbi:LemA family protein [Cellulophaga sp. L1A9]|uniref:LemA family protein n=1 Tax=Cellulophaga sp. L1A9 TaxID=2686362 RepID=UPI00131E8891|nr:LemA family protein [Cellulophaga sp. L1A9]